VVHAESEFKVTTSREIPNARTSSSGDPSDNRPRPKILVDGGDPEETLRVKQLLGCVDGQTTNPSLIAKNPDVKELVASGRRLSEREEGAEYRKIVEAISPLVGGAGVSIEVFADLDTSADQMLSQGRHMFTWIPNAYIKYPCTSEGLKAAERSVAEGIRVNITLCFSQEQAAAVSAATRGSRSPAYVSPFVGRLDDIGQNGMDLLQNIQRMYASGDGYMLVLAASIRNLQQLLRCFQLGVDLVTVPAKVLRELAAAGRPQPDESFEYKPTGAPIQYRQLHLNQSWQRYGCWRFRWLTKQSRAKTRLLCGVASEKGHIIG
jgi:transaldolase